MQEATAGTPAIDTAGEPFRSSKDTDQVFAALVAAQDEMRGIEKTGRNDHQKYDYAKLEDYVRAARPILAKHGLAITKSVIGVTPLYVKSVKTDKGEKTDTRVVVRLAIRVVHKSGQWIESYSVGEGGDMADKATYKAITGARKYGIAAALNLATTDDPEADEEYARRAMGTVDMADVATIESLKNAFAKVQVTEQMIEGFIGHPVVSMTQGEVEKLRGIFGSINSGKSKVGDYFPSSEGVGTGAASPSKKKAA